MCTLVAASPAHVHEETLRPAKPDGSPQDEGCGCDGAVGAESRRVGLAQERPTHPARRGGRALWREGGEEGVQFPVRRTQTQGSHTPDQQHAPH